MNETDLVNDEAFYQTTQGLVDEDFVQKVYQTYLNREPDEVGKSTWLNQLRETKINRLEMLAKIRQSAEFKLLWKNRKSTDVLEEVRMPLFHSESGQLLTQTGKWEEAIAHYQQAIAANPKCSSAYLKLGEAFYHLSNSSSECLLASQLSWQILPIPEHLKSFVAKFPKFSDLEFVQATRHLNNADFIRQIQHTYLNGKLQLEYQELYIRLLNEGNMTRAEIVVVIQQNQLEDKLKKLVYAIKLSQLDDRDFLQTTKELSNIEFIRVVYFTYLQRLPDEKGFHIHLQNLEDGLIDRNAFLTTVRKSEEFKRLISVAYLILSRIAASKVIELQPDFYKGHYLLGQILADLGDTSEAVLSYQRVLKIEPNYSPAQAQLGNIVPKNQNVEIISVHLPKTAGKTFLKILQQVYGGANICLYDEMDKVIPEYLPGKIQVIHGHFPVSKYENYFPQAKRIIWLRNPIERLISLYFYWKYLPNLGQTLLSELFYLVKRGEMEIEDLAKTHIGQEISHYIKGRKLRDFYFVGLQEYFKEDILHLKQLLEWKEVNLEKKENKNPNPHYQEEYLKIVNNQQLMQKLSAILAPEMAIYQEALQLREERKEKLYGDIS